MWIAISLPRFAEQVTVKVSRIYATPGQWLDPGSALLDLTVDMSVGALRDCPPVSACRIVMREGAWLRALPFGPGDEVPADVSVALLSTEADEPEAAPGRDARVTIATILHHADWWTQE